jgi:hypothetical protein
MLNKVEERYQLNLHRAQRKVAESDARFRVMACGRRWGKTRLGAALCIQTAMGGGRAWWVAPSYKMAAVGWRLVHELGVQVPGAEIRQVDRMVKLPTGGTVQIRSADDPDSLRGEGLDFAVLDECAFMKEDAWTHALRPALSDRRGKAMFISTPKGRNWFWRLYQRGKDKGQPTWNGWRFPTSDNPYIDDDEIEAAAQSLPELIFQQEYLAMFLEDAGGVFRRVMDAATATAQDERQQRIAGGDTLGWHKYVMGVDWAQQYDFTVLTVIDMNTKELIYLDRFKEIDYVIQSGRLIALAERFKPETIIAEENAMGLPNIDQLRRENVHVTPFQTTNASKAAAIDALALAFERGDIRILNDPVLIGELQAYEMTKTPTGLRKFGAPEGMHDDCVMSLALAWQGVAHAPQPLPPQPKQTSTWAGIGDNGGRRWEKF